MKKCFGLLFMSLVLLLVSCQNSTSRLNREERDRQKSIEDSIARVEQEKKVRAAEIEQQGKVAAQIKPLTLKDLYPSESFPMVWTNQFGPLTLTTKLHESGLVEITGYGECMVCNMTGICGACHGTKGRWLFYDLSYQEFLPCPNCGGTGRCSTCHGNRFVELEKTVKYLDLSNNVTLADNGNVSFEMDAQGSENTYTCPEKSTARTCSVCKGTGRIDGTVPGFGLGDPKWCDECNKEVSYDHCHGCKLCPACGGRRVIM